MGINASDSSREPGSAGCKTGAGREVISAVDVQGRQIEGIGHCAHKRADFRVIHLFAIQMKLKMVAVANRRNGTQL